MKKHSNLMLCGVLPALTTVLMLARTVAASSDGGVAQPGVAEGAPVSVDVRLTARRQGFARFRVLDNRATLQAGDEVRIDMTASRASYAYIFHRGASGEWTLLFPNPDKSGDPSATNPDRKSVV